MSIYEQFGSFIQDHGFDLTARKGICLTLDCQMRLGVISYPHQRSLKIALWRINMNFGKTIYDLRKQKNITQEELAAELGVTATAVSKWENGVSQT